jgi:hypothetical protein
MSPCTCLGNCHRGNIVQAVTVETTKEEFMSDIAMTFTAFHAIAAVGIFGFMLVSVIGAIQSKRQG